jgi:hypothetical protein
MREQQTNDGAGFRPDVDTQLPIPERPIVMCACVCVCVWHVRVRVRAWGYVGAGGGGGLQKVMKCH